MKSGTRALLILSLALLAATNAKAVDLYGKMVENELGGPPMAGVEIGAPGANPTATGSLGLFRLALPRRQPGDAVSLIVGKEGYEVVNDVQLEVILPLKPEDRPLTLLLCPPKLCEEMRRRFYRLKGVEAVEASYLRQLRELEQSTKATAAEIARLKDERDAALAAAERAAEDFSRTRTAKGSEMYQKALRLFLDGRLNEALAVLDEAELQGALAAARARKKEAERDIEQVVQGYLLRAKLLTLQLQFARAEEIYRTAVEIVPESFEASFALAEFADNHMQYAPATAAYQHCIELARKQGAEAGVAKTLNNLGRLLSAQNRHGEARNAFDEALTIRRRLAEKDPDVYLSQVAATLNNLGFLLKTQNHLDEARKAYAEALAIRRQLAEKNPDAYLPDVAGVLNNLGLLLAEQNHLDEAGKDYGEALAIYRQLAERSTDAYLPYVATTLNNLGLLLNGQNHLDEAGKDYGEALAIYRQLAERSTDAYLPYVATTLNNLGLLLNGQNRLDEARKAYDEALAIRRQLAEDNPDTYLPHVVATLNHLGRLLIRQSRLGEARKILAEAIAIIEPFAAKNPEKFQGIAENIQELLTQIDGEVP